MEPETCRIGGKSPESTMLGLGVRSLGGNLDGTAEAE